MILTIRRYLAARSMARRLFVFGGFSRAVRVLRSDSRLGDLGKGITGCSTHCYKTFCLSVPSHVYDCFRLRCLIGTLYALAHLAANSEFTVMRGSGVSPGRSQLLSAHRHRVCGAHSTSSVEFLTPASERAAQTLKLRATSAVIAQSSAPAFGSRRAAVCKRARGAARHHACRDSHLRV